MQSGDDNLAVDRAELDGRVGFQVVLNIAAFLNWPLERPGLTSNLTARLVFT